jgi:hypothetical protein
MGSVVSHGKGPRQKWLSKSAHPKEGIRKFEGPDPKKNADRNGQPTKMNSRPGPCLVCGSEVATGEGWIVMVPQGNRPVKMLVMCRPCSGS